LFVIPEGNPRLPSSSVTHKDPNLSLVALLPLLAALSLTGCRRNEFPDTPTGYREFAYVSNGKANTVSVLDLVYLRPDRTLQVGIVPSGMAVNPVKAEVYVVNSGDANGNGSVSVIDGDRNMVAATIPVHRQPYFISVDALGRRAYVANSGSNTVSVLDLNHRREIAIAGTGERPGLARITPDMRSLVVTNRASGSVSIFSVTPDDDTSAQPLKLRAAFPNCPGATDAAILPDSSKVFVACSAGHQVMAINLAAAPGSWAAKQNPSLMTDSVLALLDVGDTPVQLAMKPDGGEIFVSNFAGGTISEIATYTNEVGGTYPIGDKPVHGIVSADNSTLWVSNFAGDALSLYSIDDGKMVSSIHTGSGPDVLAFSADEHLLLAADAKSGDVSIIRTQGKLGPSLLTIMPAGASPNDIVVKALPAKN
jgi:YVTN family beta-propeller protein